MFVFLDAMSYYSSCKVAKAGQFPLTEKETTNAILQTVAENSMKRISEQWEREKKKNEHLCIQ